MKCAESRRLRNTDSGGAFTGSWRVFQRPGTGLKTVVSVPNQGLSGDHEQLGVPPPLNPHDIDGRDFVKLRVAEAQGTLAVSQTVQLPHAQEAQGTQVDHVRCIAHRLRRGIPGEQGKRLAGEDTRLQKEVARTASGGVIQRPTIQSNSEIVWILNLNPFRAAGGRSSHDLG